MRASARLMVPSLPDGPFSRAFRVAIASQRVMTAWRIPPLEEQKVGGSIASIHECRPLLPRPRVRPQSTRRSTEFPNLGRVPRGCGRHSGMFEMSKIDELNDLLRTMPHQGRRRETAKVSSLNHKPPCCCSTCCVAPRYAHVVVTASSRSSSIWFT